MNRTNLNELEKRAEIEMRNQKIENRFNHELREICERKETGQGRILRTAFYAAGGDNLSLRPAVVLATL